MNDVLRGKRMASLAAYRAPEHARSKLQIEGAVAERYPADAESVHERAEKLFDLGDHAALTADELADVQRFSEYAGKRLVHAEFFSPLLGKDANEEPAGFFVEQDHDLTHAIVRCGDPNAESLYPEVMLVDVERIFTDPKVLQEELTANLWGSAGGVLRLMLQVRDCDTLLDALANGDISRETLARMRAELGGKMVDNCQDAMLFHHVYIREMGMRRLAIRMAEKAGKDTSPYTDPHGPFDQAMRALLANPDPMYREIVQNVVDHNDDPKILLKEFQRVCAPLLARLKNRTR